MAVAQNTVIIDDVEYKPGEQLPQLGSMVVNVIMKDLRKIQTSFLCTLLTIHHVLCPILESITNLMRVRNCGISLIRSNKAK